MSPATAFIGIGWETYRQGVLPVDAPEVQRIETRRAYYAGAKAVMDVLMAIGEQPVDYEDAAVEVLADMGRELAQFLRDVKESRA